MKTMMKLGLALIVFGLVMSVLGGLAIRAHGEAKLTVRESVGAASASSAVAPASASANASGSIAASQ